MKQILTKAYVFILSALLITSCKKKEENEQFTVKGKILVSCDDNRPVKNFEIYLYNDYKAVIANNCPKGELGRAITDEDGNFEITYKTTCWKGELILRNDYDNFSYRNLVVDIGANKDYNLGSIYKENNGFYAYKIKTNTMYSDKDTLYYDIKYKSNPIVIDSTTWVFDSTYKYITGPFINDMLVEYGQTTVPHIAKENSRYKKDQIITRWVLKNGNTIHAIERNQKGYIEPCKKFSDVILYIGK